MNALMYDLLFFILLIALAIPLGHWFYLVMEGKPDRFTARVEDPLMHFLRIDPRREMNWKQYLISVLLFSAAGFILLFILLLIQGILPMNPLHLKNMNPALAFNTAASFVTNTNWQSYNGEMDVTPFVQVFGLTVQNFVSASAGICVLFALIRGFSRKETAKLGNFFSDMVSVILRVLIPLNLVLAVLLMAAGVPQSAESVKSVDLVSPVAVSSDGKIIEDAVIDSAAGTVTVNGQKVDAQILTKEYIPSGPMASQVAIKSSGTNGGGYTSTNSANPVENPNALSNALECLAILLIPASLCFTFGEAVKDKKQGYAIFAAMSIMLIAALAVMTASEANGTDVLLQGGAVNLSHAAQAGGNMQGKESRFGITQSSLYSTLTTAASNGSTNTSMDSLTPFGGLCAMLLMQVGEVVFGGVGSGLYGMLAYVIMTVFIAGLMVGRTPEFLGKTIDPYEMKWSVIISLCSPLLILLGSGIASLIPATHTLLTNTGAHGFSEMLYAFTSTGANNGSAFAGFHANTAALNICLGLIMIAARFIPMAGALAIAGNLSKKKTAAKTAGTLSTTNGLFIFLLILIVLLIGALSFFPALSLGPVAEFFS